MTHSLHALSSLASFAIMQASIEAALRKALRATDNAENPTSFAKGTAAGFVLGADDNAEASLLALHALGVSPLFLLNRDSRDMYALRAPS